MFDTITIVVGVLTLMIGVATFIMTEWDKRQRAIYSSLREWQGDSIAFIVDQSGDDGLSFNDVKSKYLAMAAQKKNGIVPKSMLQDEEIRRTLFELQSKDVMRRFKSGKFVCTRLIDPEAASEEAQKAVQELQYNMMENLNAMMKSVQERQEIVQRELHENLSRHMQAFHEAFQTLQNQQLLMQESDRLHKEIQKHTLEIAGRDPGRYNTDQIAIDVMDRTKADRVLVMIQVISLIQNGILVQDAEGKVSIRLFSIPDEVLLSKNN